MVKPLAVAFTASISLMLMLNSVSVLSAFSRSPVDTRIRRPAVSGFITTAPVVVIVSAVVPKSRLSAINVICPEPALIDWSAVSSAPVPASIVIPPGPVIAPLIVTPTPLREILPEPVVVREPTVTDPEPVAPAAAESMVRDPPPVRSMVSPAFILNPPAPELNVTVPV